MYNDSIKYLNDGEVKPNKPHIQLKYSVYWVDGRPTARISEYVRYKL